MFFFNRALRVFLHNQFSKEVEDCYYSPVDYDWRGLEVKAKNHCRKYAKLSSILNGVKHKSVSKESLCVFEQSITNFDIKIKNNFSSLDEGFLDDDPSRALLHETQYGPPNLLINPATGLPMTEGGCLDINGNAFGLNNSLQELSFHETNSSIECFQKW